MPIKLTMPALSPTMEAGKLAKWHIKEGDIVESGTLLADIETDKATMEFEAIDSGIVAKILVPEGTAGVKVNSVIAYLVEEGETFDEKALESPLPQRGKVDQNLTSTAGAGRETQSATPLFVQQSADSNKRGLFASPLARRLAKQNHIDLSSVTGSGPHGRIIKRDIEAYLSNGSHLHDVKGASIIDSRAADKQALSLYDSANYEFVPHDSMRKVIAKRLLESKQMAPHFYVSMDCQLDALLALRQELNLGVPMRFEPEEAPLYKLSVNDMLIKAIAMALKQHKDANVTWLEEGMLKHKSVDVSVAVSSENGLITPIIKEAEQKSLFVLSREAKNLISRAREKRLAPAEYQGGTTSISNMGMFGVKSFSAILNPPQATIFAIGMAEKTALVKEDEVTIGTKMNITLSADHRAIDGALAAQLMQTLKSFIEAPLFLLN